MPRVRIPLTSRPLDIVVLVLYSYFLFSCFFIERHYCAAPLDPNDSDWLLRETYEYSEKFNPLFLARPEWLRVATCMSAYMLSVGYIVGIVAILGALDILRIPLLMFCSFKLNALTLYYWIEFFGSMPVPDLGMFLAPEGPYLIALAIVLFRMRSSHPFTREVSAQKKRK